MKFREVKSFAQEHPAGAQVYICLTTMCMFPVQHWLPSEKGRRKDFCYLNIFPLIFAEHCFIFARVTHMLLQQPLYPHFPFEEAESQGAICPVFPTKEMAELRLRKSDAGSLTPKPALKPLRCSHLSLAPGEHGDMENRQMHLGSPCPLGRPQMVGVGGRQARQW